MLKEYITIDGVYENTVVIEKSKFICHIKGVNDEDEAKEFIAKTRKQNSLANHNCYAYIADENGFIQKFSDDGEPQGTAGLPMLDVLKKSNLKKVCVVITRYFGGIKLGAGGLVRAYSGGVTDCIKCSKIVSYKYSAVCEIKCSYDKYSIIQNIINSENILIIENVFENEILIKLAVKESYLERLNSLFLESFNGEKLLNVIGYSFFKFNENGK